MENNKHFVADTVAEAVKRRKGLFGNLMCCFGSKARQLKNKNNHACQGSRENIKVSDPVSLVILIASAYIHVAI